METQSDRTRSRTGARPSRGRSQAGGLPESSSEPIAVAAAPVESGGVHWNQRMRLTLLILCGAMFLDSMDVSSVNIALPTIGSHLHMSPSSLQWVVSGYALGYGGFLLLGGRISDLVGRRNVFLSALALFALASAVGGIFSSGDILIGARFVKGVAAAFTVPAGLSILTTTFTSDADRHRALGAYGVTAASGFTLGLVIGGGLAEIGWRWVFLVPAPFAAVILFLGLRVLDSTASSAQKNRRYDLPGAIGITLSMLLLVFSVVEAPSHGWGSTRTLGGLAISALLAIAFVAVEMRSRQPLLRLGILRIGSLLSANVSVFLYFGSYIGWEFLATLYIQDVLGWSPIGTALAFLPTGLFVGLGSQAPKLIGRFGTTKIIAASLVLFAIGYALFLNCKTEHLTYVTMMLPSMLLLGMSWGLSLPAFNVQGTMEVDASEQGIAAGLLSTSMQISGAILIAVVSAIISSHIKTAGGNTAAGVLASIDPVIEIIVPIVLIGAVAAFLLLRVAPVRGHGGPQQVTEDEALYAEALTGGDQL